MSSFAAYGRLEKGIAAADVGSIRQRWEYGRRLMVDRSKTTPNGNLKNDVLEKLVAAGRQHGAGKFGRREIQHRLQAARTYPSEAHIAQVLAQYENWWQVIKAGFPEVQLTLDADPTPYDPRTPEERARDTGQAIDRLAEKSAGQLELFGYFPDDTFDELSTLGELEKHAQDLTARAERHVRKNKERNAYLGRLLAAVGGDRSKTWREARDAAERAA